MSNLIFMSMLSKIQFNIYAEEVNLDSFCNEIIRKRLTAGAITYLLYALDGQIENFAMQCRTGKWKTSNSSELPLFIPWFSSWSPVNWSGTSSSDYVDPNMESALDANLRILNIDYREKGEKSHLFERIHLFDTNHFKESSQGWIMQVISFIWTSLIESEVIQDIDNVEEIQLSMINKCESLLRNLFYLSHIAEDSASWTAYARFYSRCQDIKFDVNIKDVEPVDKSLSALLSQRVTYNLIKYRPENLETILGYFNRIMYDRLTGHEGPVVFEKKTTILESPEIITFSTLRLDPKYPNVLFNLLGNFHTYYLSYSLFVMREERMFEKALFPVYLPLRHGDSSFRRLVNLIKSRLIYERAIPLSIERKLSRRFLTYEKYANSIHVSSKEVEENLEKHDISQSGFFMKCTDESLQRKVFLPMEIIEKIMSYVVDHKLINRIKRECMIDLTHHVRQQLQALEELHDNHNYIDDQDEIILKEYRLKENIRSLVEIRYELREILRGIFPHYSMHTHYNVQLIERNHFNEIDGTAFITQRTLRKISMIKREEDENGISRDKIIELSNNDTLYIRDMTLDLGYTYLDIDAPIFRYFVAKLFYV